MPPDFFLRLMIVPRAISSPRRGGTHRIAGRLAGGPGGTRVREPSVDVFGHEAKRTVRAAEPNSWDTTVRRGRVQPRPADAKERGDLGWLQKSLARLHGHVTALPVV